ncbi:MAG: hypothetical protein LLG05_18680 [Porphyromonadaceae bacterium]|nr:hypothetical protein [Porphyromonadaceae bacterium]
MDIRSLEDDEYESVVAIVEKADGNESVGTMWLETKIFDREDSLSKVITWAKEAGVTGRLIITVPDK